ncbi:MAG TPA: MDR family MFS transporter [Actinocrinis sp.]|nr:MDR family MFS transporter [Actinocrinis sp.]
MPRIPAAEAGVGPNGLTRRMFVWLIVALMVGLMLGALDQTVVVTALKSVSEQLHGLSMQAWVATAYLITSTISMAVYGSLADIYGRRKPYLAAIVIFVVGSAMSAFSQSIWELAAFRAVQGLGAGGLVGMPSIILSDVLSSRERGRYTGYILSVFGVASLIGPLIGGALAGQRDLLGIAGWRWIFLVNVPLALVALVIAAKAITFPYERRGRRIDSWGALTLVVAVVPPLVLAQQGSTWGWTSGRSVICYAVTVVGLAAFLAVQFKMGKYALIPLRLFRIGLFNISCFLNLSLGFGTLGAFVLAPLYLQVVLGESPTAAGLVTVPWMVTSIAGSSITGRLMLKFGTYRLVTLVGFGMSTVSVLLFATATPHTPLSGIVLIMAFMGLGIGLCRTPPTVAVQNVVSPQEIGVATGSTRLFQMMGGTLGTAVLLSVVFGLVTDKATSAYAAAMRTGPFNRLLTDPAVLADPANRRFVQTLTHQGVAGLNLNNPSLLTGLDPRLSAPLLAGYADAMDVAFLISGIVLAAGFVSGFWFKDVPLSRKAGNQRRAEQAGGADGNGAAAAQPAAPEPARHTSAADDAAAAGLKPDN